MDALPEGPHDTYEERLTLRGQDGAPVAAYRARPESMPRLGLVLHPDVMGLRPLFFDIARRLATHGLAVMMVEPFARVPEAERATLDVEGRLAIARELDDALQIGDLETAADQLVVDDNARDVAVLGFCMGGMQTLKAAAADRFARAVAFYGMLRVPADWRAAKLGDALDTVTEVCPTLAIFGGADSLVPLADVDALRAVWHDRLDCEVVVYPEADHGFAHDPERPTYRPADAADAWRRALAFLGVEASPEV